MNFEFGVSRMIKDLLNDFMDLLSAYVNCLILKFT